MVARAKRTAIKLAEKTNVLRKRAIAASKMAATANKLAVRILAVRRTAIKRALWAM